MNRDISGEVILADNNQIPDENLQSICTRYSFTRYVHEPTAGSYSARNSAIAIARGDVLAFTDADCLPAANWLSTGYQSVINGSDLAAGHVDLVLPEGRPANAVESYELLFAFRQSETVTKHGYGVTANLFVRHTVFGSVGYFDHTLYSGGDLEWCWRAVNHGYSISYASTAVVSHKPRSSLWQLLSKGRRIAGGQVQLRKKVPLLADHFTLLGLLKALLPPFRQYGWLVKGNEDIEILSKFRIAMIATLNKYNVTLWRFLYLAGLAGQLQRH